MRQLGLLGLMAPMVPAYGYGGGGYQQDPSVNFNFSFPR